jgi:hypothetical protein
VAVEADEEELYVAIHQLDIIEIILGFLSPMEIMQRRGVCVAWKEAARNTIVPPNYFRVHNMKTYNAMRVMTRVLPNLQQINIGDLEWGRRHKWSDGEDPDERLAAETANWISHDIEIISNFRKLQSLDIYTTQLNGRYPFLFNSFPLLQRLNIQHCGCLKWDLEMLAGFPVLKELSCQHKPRLTGNISSLRALKDTLEKVNIFGCENVEGNIMDLADFPHLKELNLYGTAVTGDMRGRGENDFSSMEKLILPKNVVGAAENIALTAFLVFDRRVSDRFERRIPTIAYPAGYPTRLLESNSLSS